MSLTLNFKSQRFIANHETVTLTLVDLRSGHASDTVTITDAVQHSITQREAAASYGVYQAGDVVWTMGRDAIEFIEAGDPKPRDTVTDSNCNVYTVLSADSGDLGKFWKLVTRNLAINAQLADTITIQTAAITSDTVMGRTETWSAVHTGIAARMQPRDAEAFDERGVRSTVTIYDVTVGQQVTVSSTDGGFGRILSGSSTYTITGYRNPERIDELPVIEARKLP